LRRRADEGAAFHYLFDLDSSEAISRSTSSHSLD
jgi:hypothetical protein